MTLKEIIEIIREVDPEQSESDEGFQCMVTLLAAANIGTTISKLREFTGYPQRKVRKWCMHWHKNGVFKDDRVFHSGWDEEGGAGTVAFILDSCIGMGYVGRVNP